MVGWSRCAWVEVIATYFALLGSFLVMAVRSSLAWVMLLSMNRSSLLCRLTMAFAFGQLGSQWGGFASRFDGGCNEGHADGFDCKNISWHPWNWCLRMHGAHDSSVVIGIRYVIAWWCRHPQNLFHVVDIVRGSGFFKFVGICL